jgi:hypothetical protein
MRIAVPIMLLITALGACEVWPQSLPPDNRYVLKTGARYISGYPYVPRTGEDRPKSIQGDLYLGINALQFRFCSLNNDGQPDPLAEGVAESVDKSHCEGRCGAQSCMEVRIPYSGMRLLARGRVATVGGTSEDLQVGSAALGIVGLVASIATGGNTEKWLIGSTIGVGAVGFGFHVLALRRANYMSIFFAPSHPTDPTSPCAGGSSLSAAPAAATPAQPAATGADARNPAVPPPPRALNLFADASGCNVAIFQIFNGHQYWNMSMILNARTGKEFISQNAEQK